jgi:sec-independent protein translocase protein TatA
MGSFSLMHWLVVIVVALILFGGKGRLTNVMGDLASGIKSFRKGLSDEDKQSADGSASEKPAPEKPRAIEDFSAKERDKTGV